MVTVCAGISAGGTTAARVSSCARKATARSCDDRRSPASGDSDTASAVVTMIAGKSESSKISPSAFSGSSAGGGKVLGKKSLCARRFIYRSLVARGDGRLFVAACGRSAGRACSANEVAPAFGLEDCALRLADALAIEHAALVER